jgi:anti-sigma factor RsiW
MNCRRVVNSISAYVDGELTGVEMLELRRHLGQCPECMDEYESLRMAKLAVSRLGTVTPREDLAACIIRKLDHVSTPPYQRALTRMFRFAGRKLSPVAAALAVSGIALAFLAAGGQDRMLTQKSEVMASAPLSLQVQSVSFVPQVPESSMMYSSSRPLVVANDSSSGSFRLADLSVR